MPLCIKVLTKLYWLFGALYWRWPGNSSKQTAISKRLTKLSHEEIVTIVHIENEVTYAWTDYLNMSCGRWGGGGTLMRGHLSFFNTQRWLAFSDNVKHVIFIPIKYNYIKSTNNYCHFLFYYRNCNNFNYAKWMFVVYMTILKFV